MTADRYQVIEIISLPEINQRTLVIPNYDHFSGSLSVQILITFRLTLRLVYLLCFIISCMESFVLDTSTRCVRKQMRRTT